MKEQKKCVPEIRFAGFTDDWEQRKLGEVVERVTRKNYLLESSLPLTISAQDGLIAQNEFFDKQVASKNIRGYYLIRKGEFAYNKSYSNGYPWGAIKRLDNYLDGVLSTLYIVFKPININSQYLVSYFNANYWHKEIASIAVEGARNHGLLNIPVNDFFNISISLPKSKEEQTAIGNFFKQLDDTIALHQRTLEKYQKLKISYLEKMFPKENEQFPELRFPNFTDAWEQRKLGEVVNTFEYGLNVEAKAFDGINKYIRITDIDDESRTFLQKDLTSPNIDIQKVLEYKLVLGDILFARTGASVGKTYLFDKKDGSLYFAGFLIRANIKESFNANFIFQNTLTKNFDNFVSITSQRSGQPGINAKEYASFEFLCPSLAEQTTIGNFFKQLDDTIALHQREVEKYKKIKQAYLEKMFI